MVKILSSGQAQLISLARIVAQKKDFFLLDEATSTVDSVTTNKINKAIKKIFSKKNSNSHSPPTQHYPTI